MKRPDWILLASLCAASSAWCLTSGRQLGATFDEPFYLQGGLDYWRNGHFGTLLAAGTMPLAQHVQSLPVFLAERMSGRSFSIEQDLGQMLALARPVTLLFWALLLASTMRLGRVLGGPWGGRAAVVLVALEPNFLAHASLATTDIALAACVTAFAVELLTRRDQPARWRIGVPALWFGLALSAKVSALALLPFVAVAAVLRAAGSREEVRRLLVDCAAVATLGLVFALIYCGTGGQTWLAGTLERMPVDHWLRPAIAWLGSLPLFPNALYAIWFQFAHNQAGQAVFIAGTADTRAIWYFVPAMLGIKLALPTILALLIAIARSPAPSRTLGIAAAFLLATMIVFQVQTGIRFLLPLLALTMAWAGSRLGMLASQGRALAASLLAVMLIDAAMAWPDGLRHVNPLWGGARDGYRAVSDSNYDWGQGLPELARWQQAHQGALSMWYFGTDTRYPQITRINPRLADFDPRSLKGTTLAVSVSLLYGGYLETPGPARDLVQQLRALEPDARTSTFFIYSNLR